MRKGSLVLILGSLVQLSAFNVNHNLHNTFTISKPHSITNNSNKYTQCIILKTTHLNEQSDDSVFGAEFLFNDQKKKKFIKIAEAEEQSDIQKRYELKRKATNGKHRYYVIMSIYVIMSFSYDSI